MLCCTCNSIAVTYFAVGIDCGNAGSVANGRVIVTDTIVGSRVRVECNNGFLLNGEPERVCQDNGRWSGVLPTCKGTYTMN